MLYSGDDQQSPHHQNHHAKDKFAKRQGRFPIKGLIHREGHPAAFQITAGASGARPVFLLPATTKVSGGSYPPSNCPIAANGVLIDAGVGAAPGVQIAAGGTTTVGVAVGVGLLRGLEGFPPA